MSKGVFDFFSSMGACDMSHFCKWVLWLNILFCSVFVFTYHSILVPFLSIMTTGFLNISICWTFSRVFVFGFFICFFFFFFFFNFSFYHKLTWRPIWMHVGINKQNSNRGSPNDHSIKVCPNCHSSFNGKDFKTIGHPIVSYVKLFRLMATILDAHPGHQIRF